MTITQDTLVGKRSPWGRIDYSKRLGDGIYSVGTSGHGGLKLDRHTNSRIDRSLRRSGGWYEEDCEAAIVIAAFPELFSSRELSVAHKTMKNWYPAEYSKLTGETVTLEESYILRKEQFERENTDRFVVIAAWRTGDDEVTCRARQQSTRNITVFKITQDEYRAGHTEFGYVLN